MSNNEPAPALPDVFPTISVSTDYAEWVESFDVDIQAITEHLHARGLTDDQISALTIDFVDTPAAAENRRGSYSYKEKRIEINTIDTFLRNVVLPPMLSMQMTETLAHELEHHVSSYDDNQRKINRAYARRKQREYEPTSQPEKLLRTFGILTGVLVTGTALSGGPETLGAIEFYEHATITAIAISAMTSIIDGLRARRAARKDDLAYYMENPEEIRARSHAFEYITSDCRELVRINGGSEVFQGQDGWKNFVAFLGKRANNTAEE